MKWMFTINCLNWKWSRNTCIDARLSDDVTPRWYS